MIYKQSLSICADDFGITQKVNKAIINLIEEKRITEVSCMVLAQDFKNDAKELAKYKDKIGIGIHLTLTDFKPITKISSLIKKDKLLSIKNLLVKSIFRNYSKDEIFNEINFQLNEFEKIMGFKPNFVDGHHHVQQLPMIRNILIQILKKRYPNDLPWVRNTYENFFKILRRNVSILKAISLSVAGSKLKKLNKINSIRTNDGFSGVYNFSEKARYDYLFESFISFIKDNHLLMVHPGISDEILSKIDRVTTSRDKEYNFLLSENFLKILKDKNIKLKPLFF
jgi:chitin disaccharide deacetylase